MIELYKADVGMHRREYYCLSTDIAALPMGDGMYTGCTAYCVDTGDLYMYDSESEQWRLQ